MCDCSVRRGTGWKGWPIYGPSLPAAATGPWYDLSHVLSPSTPKVHTFPKPSFDLIRSLPGDHLNITQMSMVAHIGTHVDSPRHFYLDAPALDDIPFERLSGRGLVHFIDLDGPLIELNHLTTLEGRVRPGDILILDTGYHLFVGTNKYDDDHPSLSMDAAEWCVKANIKMIGLDVPTPELPLAKRPPNFDFPIHRKLLAHGILIAEHLTNLTPLRGKEVEVVCGALSIAGGDGSPARIVARPIN